MIEIELHQNLSLVYINILNSGVFIYITLILKAKEERRFSQENAFSKKCLTLAGNFCWPWKQFGYKTEYFSIFLQHSLGLQFDGDTHLGKYSLPPQIPLVLRKEMDFIISTEQIWLTSPVLIRIFSTSNSRIAPKIFHDPNYKTKIRKNGHISSTLRILINPKFQKA